MRANHGGGYAYRLCPVESNLTEACFAAHPVPFTGDQYFLFSNGTRQRVPNATYGYANGTLAAVAPAARPVGPTWARNPIPDACQVRRTEAAGRQGGRQTGTQAGRSLP